MPLSRVAKLHEARGAASLLTSQLDHVLLILKNANYYHEGKEDIQMINLLYALRHGIDWALSQEGAFS